MVRRWRFLKDLHSRMKDSIETVSHACHPTLMRSIVIVMINIYKYTYYKGFYVLPGS